MKTEQEKMVAGELYKGNDVHLYFQQIKAIGLASKFNHTREWQLWKRKRIIKKLFPHGGENAFFRPGIRVEYGWNVTYGKNFYMNFDCGLFDVSPIKIGDNVMFGPRVMVATPVHPLVADERIQQDHPDGFYDLEYSKPITIGNNVWVASGAIICGGVTIGDNTVIAAGSVVVRDIPANVLAGGVPCKVIRPITDADRLMTRKVR
jgi:maltose O-acetyltransferase